MKSLSELLNLHRDLDALFFAHQSALLRFEFDKALRLLERYESFLLRHIRDEEELLFPIYSERAEVIKGGRIELFLNEHYKMKELVKFFKEEISTLSSEPNPDAKVILLLDGQSFFKRLCGHHDKREAEFLYPALDRVTTDREKYDLLNRIACSFPVAERSQAES